MLKNTICSLFVITLIFNSKTQISVTNTQTPSQLVQDVLLGTGVTATNIKYNGSLINALATQTNATYFNSAGTTFPISDGVLLSSGAGIGAIGPNDEGSATDATGTSVITDIDMSAITPNTVTNGVVIEFDFIATGDSVSFQYIFGSEEYPSDYGAMFYDVFGFFLSGPGFAGPYSGGGVNIATLPGTTTPISILNLNPTTNVLYYVDNQSGLAYGSSIQYDGTSVLMRAGAQLICGETYHIKLGISNVGDQAFDSGVFLKGGSFSSDAVNIQAVSSTGIVIDSLLLEEGCNSTQLMFIRPLSQTDSLGVFHVQSSGTIDVVNDLNSYVDSVVFNIGVDTVYLSINPIDDGIIEPMEVITIMVYSVTTCGDTLYDSVRIYIVDKVTVDLSSTPATCNPDGSVTALAVGNIGTPVYSWTGPSPSVADTVHTTTYTNLSSGWYVMTLADDQCTIKDSVFVDILNPPIANIGSLTTSGSTPATFLFTNTSENSTNYEWDFDNGFTTTSSDLSSQGSTYITAGNYTIQLIAISGLCSDTTYLTIEVVDDPILEAPNVFSPNGDGANALYHLNAQHVTKIELKIIDRWGVEVFANTSVNPGWDGTSNGKKLDDGVYFYKYTATGVSGKILTGSGFLHLIR